MTGDDFRDRYQILKRLTSGEVPTFLARAKGGDRVMVHVLQTPPGLTRELLARVARLSGELDRRVREVTRHRGTDVLVTDFLEDFESLEAWLPEVPAAGEGPAGASGDADGGQEKGAGEAGEFTRLFQQPTAGEGAAPSGDAGTAGDREPEAEAEEGAPGRQQDPTSTGADEAPAGDDADAGAREADAEKPGEFTRMFEFGEAPPPESGTSEGRASGAERTGPAAPEEPPSGEGDEASEEDDGSGPPEAAGPVRPEEEPGEFTRLFEARGSREGSPEREGTSGEAEASPDAPTPPTSSEPAPRDDRADESTVGDDGDDSRTGEAGGEQPGEFTRMFGSASSGPGTTGSGAGGVEGSGAADSPDRRPEPASEEETPAGGRTAEETAPEERDDPSPEGAVREADAGEPEPDRPDVDTDEGPGEFTRMFGSPDAEPDDLPASTDPRGTGPSPPGMGSEGSDGYLERLGRVGTGGPGDGGSGDDPGTDPSGSAASGGGTVDGEAGGGRQSEGPGRYTRMVEQPSAGSGTSGSGSAGGGGSGARSPFDPSPSSAGGGTTAGEGGGGDEDGGGGPSRTVYLVALGGVLVFALALVLIVLLVTGDGDEGAGGASPGEEVPDSARVSTLPGEHHQQLQLGIREVGRHVDGQVPGLTDGGPVVA